MGYPLPLNDNILVIEDPDQTVTDSGIALPELRRKTVRSGKVVAVGPGRFLPDFSYSTMYTRIGDGVTFDLMAGTEITHEGQKLTVLPERSVLLITSEE